VKALRYSISPIKFISSSLLPFSENAALAAVLDSAIIFFLTDYTDLDLLDAAGLSPPMTKSSFPRLS